MIATAVTTRRAMFTPIIGADLDSAAGGPGQVPIATAVTTRRAIFTPIIGADFDSAVGGPGQVPIATAVTTRPGDVHADHRRRLRLRSGRPRPGADRDSRHHEAGNVHADHRRRLRLRSGRPRPGADRDSRHHEAGRCSCRSSAPAARIFAAEAGFIGRRGPPSAPRAVSAAFCLRRTGASPAC